MSLLARLRESTSWLRLKLDLLRIIASETYVALRLVFGPRSFCGESQGFVAEPKILNPSSCRGVEQHEVRVFSFMVSAVATAPPFRSKRTGSRLTLELPAGGAHVRCRIQDPRN